MNGVMADNEWRQNDDARTLAEAETIRNDKGRLSGAQLAASRLIAEREKEMAGLKAVAGKPAKSSPAKVDNSFVLPRIAKK